MVTLVTGVAFILPEVLAQVSINYPKNREVFQRDKNNSATIYIAGSYTEAADRVEAQLVPVQGGNHSGWITIQNNPQGGQFYGSLDWSGGWYTLEVRVRENESYVTAKVQRVGVGEVFLVSGHSVAHGGSRRAPAGMAPRHGVFHPSSSAAAAHAHGGSR